MFSMMSHEEAAAADFVIEPIRGFQSRHHHLGFPRLVYVNLWLRCDAEFSEPLTGHDSCKHVIILNKLILSLFSLEFNL